MIDMGKVCIDVNCCEDCPYYTTGLTNWHCKKLELSGKSENLYKVCPLNNIQTVEEWQESWKYQKESFVWFCISCILVVILVVVMLWNVK